MHTTTTQPGPFYRSLVAYEFNRHKTREAELSALEGLLPQFEPYVQKLVEQGMRVEPSCTFLSQHGDVSTIHISRGCDWTRDVALYDCLCNMGFEEVSRNGIHYSIVVLTNGQLRLAMTLPRNFAPPVIAVAGSANVRINRKTPPPPPPGPQGRYIDGRAIAVEVPDEV